MFDQIVEAWCRSLPADPITLTRLRDLVLLDARGRGVGRALLTEALEWLRAKAVTQVTFAAYAPGYILPGCDRALYPAGAKLLESLGFETYTQAAAMDRSLVGYTPSLARLETLAAAGWRFGTPTVDDLIRHGVSQVLFAENFATEPAVTVQGPNW